MSFEIYRIIQNGKVNEYPLSGLNPNLNYRFKVVATNNDGASPDSNVVEWGAIRPEGRAFWTPSIGTIAYSSGQFPSSMPAGYWVGEYADSTLYIKHYDKYWDGSGDPLTITEFPNYSEDAELKFYMIEEPNGVESGMFIKYVPSGTVHLYVMYKDNFDAWSFKEVTIESFDSGSPLAGLTVTDLVVMNDGLLLLKGEGEGVMWGSRQPDDTVRNFSNVQYANTTDAQLCVGVDPIPHHVNAYPVSLDQGFTDPHFYVNYIDQNYVQDGIATLLTTAPTSGELYVDVEASNPRGIVTPMQNIYWTGLVMTDGDTVVTVAYDKDAGVLTNITDWASVFVINERLYVSGLTDENISSAPNTPVPGATELVNIHMMNNLENTGFGGSYADVGPNLWVLSSGNPSTYNYSTVTVVGSPDNFNSVPFVLENGDLVVKSS